MDYKKNPVKAIREKCLDCCCGSSNEVAMCPAESCPVYPFRFGKNPYRAARKISEDERVKLSARLAEARNRTAVLCDKSK